MDLSNDSILSREIGSDNTNNVAISSSNCLTAECIVEPFLQLEYPGEASKSHPCRYCGKIFAKLRQYNGHLRIHSKEKLWSCEKCPQKGLMHKDQIKPHQLCHGPQQRTHICSKCSMTFIQRNELKRHCRVIHNKDRPHKCDVCVKSFFQKTDLKLHMAVHTGEKKYECMECSRKFAHISNFLRHTRRHKNSKPYICSICGERFIQLISLNNHVKRKHYLTNQHLCNGRTSTLNTNSTVQKKSRQYHCTHCGETFNYHSELVHHLASMHELHSRPESANEMLNEIVQDFNKSSGSLGENVDALIKEILSDDTNDVDSLITYNAASLHSHNKSNTENSISINNMENVASSSISCDKPSKMNELGSSNQFSNVDNLEIPNQQICINNIKLEVLADYFNADDVMNDDSNSLNVRSICNELGVSMLQDIEIYLPPKANNCPGMELCDNFVIYNDPDLNFLPVNSDTEQVMAEPQNSSTVDVATGCATIFESDMDLEHGSMLAENLNQLIEQNNVRFISADDSDTYIISVNTSMDAEKLSTFLNIENVQITIDDVVEMEKSRNEENQMMDSGKDSEVTIKLKESQNPIKTNSKQNNSEKLLHICKICKKSFKNKYNHKSHLGLHFAKYRKHKCDICKQCFCWKSSLNKHIKAAHSIHKQPTPKCNICMKMYMWNWQVTEHIRREHDGEKSYHCNEAKCTRQFFKKNDLILHIRTHTKERPLVCSRCPRSFSHPSHLCRHERIPHGKQNGNSTTLLCRDCGRAFRQRAALTNHKLHCCKQVPIIATVLDQRATIKPPQGQMFDSGYPGNSFQT